MPRPTVLLLSTSDTDLITARASGAEYRWANPSRLIEGELEELLAGAGVLGSVFDVEPVHLIYNLAFLLLIAVANVAGLFTLRAVERAPELAVRASLGASRRQILGLLLAESAVIAAIGGGVGLAVEDLAHARLGDAGAAGRAVLVADRAQADDAAGTQCTRLGEMGQHLPEIKDPLARRGPSHRFRDMGFLLPDRKVDLRHRLPRRRQQRRPPCLCRRCLWWHPSPSPSRYPKLKPSLSPNPSRSR